MGLSEQSIEAPVSSPPSYEPRERGHPPQAPVSTIQESPYRGDYKPYTYPGDYKPYPYSFNETPPALNSDQHAVSSLAERSFHYRPIEDASIRLIRFLPERKAMLKCEIIHVSLEQPPPYIAVSYTWGDIGDTRKIEVEGCQIPIAVSLHGALQALRQKEASVLVWVDALCINFKNRNERSQHVQLMPHIYSRADHVAIWLGPEDSGSTRAVEFLKEITKPVTELFNSSNISQLLEEGTENGDLLSVVSLFRREYWGRLWVVQEVFNAKKITVYCGPTALQWKTYQNASTLFSQRRGELDFNKNDQVSSPEQFSYVQTLLHQGPASFPDLKFHMSDGEEALLQVLRICRRKLASDPRDKLFGILGVLPASIRNELRVDYNLSVKDVYTKIVDFLLKTTDKLDFIGEAVHFPVHTSSTNLPTFVPDWSHIPQTSGMGFKYGFSASRCSPALYRFCDERLNKLEISGLEIDVVQSKGIAVGELCNLGDYLMAFLHWRALLFQAVGGRSEQEIQWAEECFAATISLGQIPQGHDRQRWQAEAYHVFANMFRERLSYIPLDDRLCGYMDIEADVTSEMRRQFLQANFGDRMMGRCFCLTQNQRMGMGSGFMLAGDIIVVPLGCSTPILLRPEGSQGEYRYVGDIYVDGYMFGKAVDQWEAGQRELKTYVLH
ncbi:hypothetical protein F53441_11789 [Fusarium austroafricanum]|uniref:Heterokaryon incompatibility domain-containing protein n=1 Tax=Fusarium austroafricanum TaxID=2364996 RepID=A0A8H4K290_9HYPO|nr:hypothetical protein F53441_11789 [Fusarium austroafricanum]